MSKVTYRGVPYDTVDYASRPTVDVDVVLTYRGTPHETTVQVVSGNHHLEMIRQRILKERLLHDAQMCMVR